MSGSVSRAAQYLRSVVLTRPVLGNLKQCGALRHQMPPIQAEKMWAVSKTLSFSPRSISEVSDTTGGPSITDFPLERIPFINPRSILPIIEDIVIKQDITLPAVSEHEVHAVRLIVIRRKKMRKHKLRKLRKKMRSRWHQVKQRRRIKKEKAFRAELVAMIKEADTFSAEQYVADKIAQANHTPLPRFYKGKRLPVFMMRQVLGLDPKINYKHTDVYKA